MRILGRTTEGRSVLDRVEHHGEYVTILRYKTPAAVLVPVTWYKSAQAALSAYGPGCDPEASNR